MVTYVLDDERRHITVTAVGPLTKADILAVIQRRITERTWAYTVLYDVRGVDALPDSESTAEIAAYLKTVVKGLGKRGAFAIVSRDPSMVGCARQSTDIEANVGPFGLFTALEDAERWLSDHPPIPFAS